MLGLKDRLEVVYETQVGNPGISTQGKKKKGNSKEDLAREDQTIPKIPSESIHPGLISFSPSSHRLIN